MTKVSNYISGVSDELWRQLLERDEYKCLKCNNENDLSPAHYKSRGSGGTEDDLNNLMLLCWLCHRKLHDGKMLVKLINGKFFFRDNK